MREKLERGFHGRDGQLAAAEGPGKRVLLDSGHGRGLSDDEPRLRAADELVAAEAGDIDAGGHASPDERLRGEAERPQVDERAAPDVVDDRDPGLAAQVGELLDLRLGREAEDAVIAVMDAQDGPGRRADRRLVVAEMGLVRRADLAHDRPARGHHVGHAERPADLDELAPRDDDLFSESESVEDEDGARGVVVADRGRFGPGQLGRGGG